MFRSGKLNVDDEFYNYVDLISINFKEVLQAQSGKSII